MAAVMPIQNILCTLVANRVALGYFSSRTIFGMLVWKHNAEEKMVIDTAVCEGSEGKRL